MYYIFIEAYICILVNPPPPPPFPLSLIDFCFAKNRALVLYTPVAQ